MTPAKVQKILSHIKTLDSFPKTEKTAWEELAEFETAEAVETLKKCGIKEGMTVLNMGCGHGHYTFAASIAAGENGKVIAVNNEADERVIKYLEKKVADFYMKNIKCLKTNETGFYQYTDCVNQYRITML